jgi:hypothetical protein
MTTKQYELIKVDYNKGETTVIATYDTEAEATDAQRDYTHCAITSAYPDQSHNKFLVRPAGSLRRFSERMNLEQI